MGNIRLGEQLRALGGFRVGMSLGPNIGPILGRDLGPNLGRCCGKNKERAQAFARAPHGYHISRESP